MSSHKDQHETLSVHAQEQPWLAHRYLHIIYLQIQICSSIISKSVFTYSWNASLFLLS